MKFLTWNICRMTLFCTNAAIFSIGCFILCACLGFITNVSIIMFVGLETFKKKNRNNPLRLMSLNCEMVGCTGGAKEFVCVCTIGSDYNVNIVYTSYFSTICQVVVALIQNDRIAYYLCSCSF